MDAERQHVPGYRCVRRLHHKRLLTFLRRQGYHTAVLSMMDDVEEEFFRVGHLKHLVQEGLWEDALRYLHRYLPPDRGGKSFRAHVLLAFVRIHSIFADIFAGNTTSPGVKLLRNKFGCYLENDLSVSRATLRIRSIVFSILYSESVRASLDWSLVSSRAGEIIHWWSLSVPELKRHHPYVDMPYDVPLIAFGIHQRRQVKKRQVKKRGRRPDKLAVAEFFCLTKRKFLPSDPDDFTVGLSPKSMDHLADFLDESLAAGKRWESYSMAGKYSITQPLELSVKEDAHGGLLSKTMLDTLTDHAKNSVISSVTNAEKNSQAGLELHQEDQLLSSGKEGTPFIPFPNMVGTTTGSAQHSGFSSVTNAGTSKHPRAKLTTVEEEDLDLKRRRTTGTFAEASLMPAIETEACLPVFSA